MCCTLPISRTPAVVVRVPSESAFAITDSICAIKLCIALTYASAVAARRSARRLLLRLPRPRVLRQPLGPEQLLVHRDVLLRRHALDRLADHLQRHIFDLLEAHAALAH